MVEIELNFDKRYEDKVGADANIPGIYVVFAFNGDANAPRWELLDIGQSDNIYQRHLSHERRQSWESFASENSMHLIIYTARITNEYSHRDIAEAALLFRFQPRYSSDGKQGFHHGDVHIIVKGRLEAAFGAFVQRNTDF